MNKKEPPPSHSRLDEKDNIDFEIAFYESLIQKDPNFSDALIALAENYTHKGRYEDGLKIDLKLSELLPHDPRVHYNLACSFSLLNRVPEAFETLKKALSLGYEDFRHLEEDPDLSNLRAYPKYEELKKTFLKSQDLL